MRVYRAIGIIAPSMNNATVSMQGVGTKTTNQDGYCVFEQVPVAWPYSHLTIIAQGYQDYSAHLDLPTDHDKNFNYILDGEPNQISSDDIHLLPMIKLKLSPITVSGKDFLVYNMRYKMKGCTDFLILIKHARGEDIRPILEERSKLGFDTLRFFTTCYNITQFDPRKYDIGLNLSEVLDLMSQYSLRGLCEGFADIQLLRMTQDECTFHHETLCDVIRNKTNCIYDLVNEFEQNGIDPTKFAKPEGVISSSGSRVDNRPPAQPFWDFACLHPRRDGEDYYYSKWLTDIPNQAEVYNGWFGQPILNRPFITDEPRGYSAINQPGKRSNQPRCAYQAGWLGGQFMNGTVFHSDNGVQSDLFNSVTKECARMFIAGFEDSRKGW